MFKSGYYNIRSNFDSSVKLVFCDMEDGNYEDDEDEEELTLIVAAQSKIHLFIQIIVNKLCYLSSLCKKLIMSLCGFLPVH